MRKTQFVSLALGLALLSFSCRDGEREAVKNAEAEVFKLHDEVMPLTMTEIPKLQTQLRSRLAAADSATGGQPTQQVRSAEDREQLMRINQQLRDANQSMDDWMSQYKGDTLAKLTDEEALRYLADQKEKITDVNKKVNESIQQARQLLGNR